MSYLALSGFDRWLTTQPEDPEMTVHCDECDQDLMAEALAWERTDVKDVIVYACPGFTKANQESGYQTNCSKDGVHRRHNETESLGIMRAHCPMCMVEITYEEQP